MNMISETSALEHGTGVIGGEGFHTCCRPEAIAALASHGLDWTDIGQLVKRATRVLGNRSGTVGFKNICNEGQILICEVVTCDECDLKFLDLRMDSTCDCSKCAG